MKTIFTSLSLALLFLLTPIVSFAQVPEGIHYQATIRDAGNLVANQSVTVEFTIWETVVPIYRETQVLTTNAYGHLSAQVGTGTSSLGNFSDVDWTIADHFLQARVDLGSGFVDLGLSEMIAVPFAQHSGTASAADFGLDGLEDVSISSPGNGQVLTWNGSNWEAQTPSTGTTYTAGSGINISGSVISNTGDVNASDDLTIGSNASGDLSGTYPAPEVSSIRGQAVSAAAPSNGEVLKWNGSAWAPAVDDQGTSPWSQNGASIYYNSGFVGIGTNGPQGALHIYGRLRLGTAEYFRDGGINEIEALGDITPSFDNIYDLGTASFRWNDVFATNGTIQTSDLRDKKKVQPIGYGLNEIMQMRPVRFQWKDQPGEEEKLGLIAQDLLQVVPEVVKTHNYEPQEEDNQMVRVELERLGVYYSDLIPVMIQAMQEQQEEIEALKKEIAKLKKN